MGSRTHSRRVIEVEYYSGEAHHPEIYAGGTLQTPDEAPRASVICERFVGVLRRECLDHMLVIGELQLIRVLKGYVSYFNLARPHQEIAQ